MVHLNLTEKNVTDIYLGYFVMHNKKTTCMGELLDIFKMGNNSKYGSLLVLCHWHLWQCGILAIRARPCMSSTCDSHV
jgi:hypothetical protein